MQLSALPCLSFPPLLFVFPPPFPFSPEQIRESKRNLRDSFATLVHLIYSKGAFYTPNFD